MSATSVCALPVVSAACDTASAAATTTAASTIESLADMMGGAADFTLRTMWALLDSTTLVDVTSGHYTRVYNLVFGLALLVMLVFFLLQVIGAMIRREPAALSRAVLGLAKSVLGSFVVIALTAALLEITDRACIGLVAAAGTSMEQIGDRLLLMLTGAVTLSNVTPGVGALIALFLAGLAVGAVFIVWVSLLVRKALLLVAVVLAPVALAGATWDATRGWVGRWATFVVALILSKFVVIVVFLLATANVSAPIDDGLQSVSDALAGVVLLLIAGFAPFLTYKAISFIGLDLYHAISAEEEAKRAVNRPMPVMPGLLGGGVGRQVSSVLRSSDGGSGTSGGASATGAGGSTGTLPAGGAPGGMGAKAAAGSAGTASTGAASGAAGAGAATGAAAVAAPVVAGAMLAKAAATAGPKLGQSVGQHAAQASDAPENQSGTPARPSSGSTPAPPSKPPPPKPTPGILYKDGDRS